MRTSQRTLKEISTLITKGTTPTTMGRPFVEEGINFIKAEALNGDTSLERSGFAFIDEETHRLLQRSILEENDVLVTIAGANTGKCGFVRETDLPANTNQAVGIVRINHESADPRFVYYFFKQKRTFDYIQTLSAQAAQPNLNLTSLGKIRISLPLRCIQTRIAAILSAYDDPIENNRRRIQLLEQAARLIYKEWFVRLRFPGHEHVKVKDGVPEGWERKRLSELCTDIRESIDPKTLPPETAYIGLEHIPRRSITLSDWGTAAEIDSSKFKFIEGDILFGKIRPYFHKVGFALVGGITSSDAIVIRSTDSLVYHYVLLLLSSDEFVSLASKTVREGSKMPRADWKFLLKSEFNRPAKAVLELFNDSMKPICAQLKNLALHNQQLIRARDLLLLRLMSGGIAV